MEPLRRGVVSVGEAARAMRLDDEALLAECDVEVFVGPGPGGQHRNKTESAVRLRHRPTGLTARATERRSQLQNRDAALERLRRLLARAATVKPLRRPTRPTAGGERRRLEAKHRAADRKALRRKDWT